MAEVELRRLTKVFPTNVCAVADLSLRINDGESVVLLGPSGCGKTTTLRLIAGLEAPTSGEVWIGGRSVVSVPVHRRGVAMVFQRPALYPHWTVRQNLAFGGRGDPHDRPAAPNGAERLAALTGALQIDGLLEQWPRDLSVGQQQRVALGRALLREPQVLLLDEPLSHVDVPLRKGIRDELHLLQRRLRTTMVYVTHDPQEALSLADRVALLEGGRLRQWDGVEALVRRPPNRWVAAAFAAQGANFLPGHLAVREGRLWFAWQELLLPLPDEARERVGRAVGVTLGLPPGAVRLRTEATAGPEDRSPPWTGCLELEGTTLLAEGGWLVTLCRGGRRLEALSPEQPRVAVGEPLEVALALHQAHLFDAATGRSLWQGPGRKEDR